MRGPNNIDWNNENWDAQRLMREFISLKAWDYRGKTMEELVWSDQILFQRLIAVIHAYIGDPFHRTGIPFSTRQPYSVKADMTILKHCKIPP